jgi:hypothetical protein
MGDARAIARKIFYPKELRVRSCIHWSYTRLKTSGESPFAGFGHAQGGDGTSPGRFEAPGIGVKVEVAEVLAAQGRGVADGAVGLEVGAGRNRHQASKNSYQLPVVGGQPKQ